MAERKAAFIYTSELEKYSYPPGHPFNTIRAKKTRDLAQSMDMLNVQSISEVSPEPADRLVLKKFHTARYLHALRRASAGHRDTEALQMGIGTSDCPIFAGLFEYAALATGASITAARLILSGDADVAFNPSGGYHHAFAERASGFCYVNDVALACTILAEQHKKVFYLDVDVHHGDGVVYAFYDRPDVMTISFHQNPKTLFPGTGFADEIGTGRGTGYCVNVPVPIGTYAQAYMTAFESVALPLIGAYQPDVFVFELGADSLAKDPLGNLRLTNDVYVDIINHLLTFDRPILMTGGGGYNIENTVRAWTLAWGVLCGAYREDDINMALGGIMLESTEWSGGLRDRTLAVTNQQREAVMPALKKTIETIKKNVFPIHNIGTK